MSAPAEPMTPLGWDSRGTRDDPMNVGLICPDCCALIPPGADANGLTYQRRHMDWHAALNGEADQ